LRREQQRARVGRYVGAQVRVDDRHDVRRDRHRSPSGDALRLADTAGAGDCSTDVHHTRRNVHVSAAELGELAEAQTAPGGQ
jgi:hypothetical protein